MSSGSPWAAAPASTSRRPGCSRRAAVDNLFVFALILGYFKVPRACQHRVLFFGVLGALVFRGIFLGVGVTVVTKFTAILFVFAAILRCSAYKLVKGEDDTYDPGSSLALRLLRRVIPPK